MLLYLFLPHHFRETMYFFIQRVISSYTIPKFSSVSNYWFFFLSLSQPFSVLFPRPLSTAKYSKLFFNNENKNNFNVNKV